MCIALAAGPPIVEDMIMQMLCVAMGSWQRMSRYDLAPKTNNAPGLVQLKRIISTNFTYHLADK